jgi:hypothetical protein
VWTGFDFCLMLGHFHTHRRQIKNLVLFTPLGYHIRQTVLTVRTTFHALRLRPGGTWFWNGAQRQRMAWIAQLVPHFFSHSAGADCVELASCTITRQWLTMIVAVLGHMVLQCLDPHRQRLDSLLLFLHGTDPVRCKSSYQGDDSFFTFNTASMYLFSVRQA